MGESIIMSTITRSSFTTVTPISSDFICGIRTGLLPREDIKLTIADLTSLILASVEDPLPIGFVYVQFPGDLSPAGLNLAGTWQNVSSEMAGDFIRFEGGSASAFESGTQLDQFQSFIIAATGYGQLGTSTGITIGGGTDTGNAYGGDKGATIPYEISDDGVNGTPRVGSETRAVNKTVRKWRRVS